MRWHMCLANVGTTTTAFLHWYLFFFFIFFFDINFQKKKFVIVFKTKHLNLFLFSFLGGSYKVRSAFRRIFRFVFFSLFVCKPTIFLALRCSKTCNCYVWLLISAKKNHSAFYSVPTSQVSLLAFSVTRINVTMRVQLNPGNAPNQLYASASWLDGATLKKSVILSDIENAFGTVSWPTNGGSLTPLNCSFAKWVHRSSLVVLTEPPATWRWPTCLIFRQAAGWPSPRPNTSWWATAVCCGQTLRSFAS